MSLDFSNLERLANEIADFSPRGGDWHRLDEIASELWMTGQAKDVIWAPFALFERFPENEDGAGVFWTILHGIEALDGYGYELASSLKRQPSEFGILLAGRMLNAGVETLDGVSLTALLRSIAQSPTCPKSLVATSLRFLERNRDAER